MKLTIVVNGITYEVEVEAADEESASESSSPFPIAIQSSVLPSLSKTGAAGVDEAKVCRSPLAGVVLRVQAAPGQKVATHDLLLVLDAMKMEIKITAQALATVRSVEVTAGDAVKPGQVLVCFE